MGLFAFLFSLIISIGIGAYQQRQARKRARRAREKFEANAGITARPESGGQAIPLAYGATAVNGILAYAQTRSIVTDDMVPDTWGALEAGEAKSYAFLLAQYVLCAAGGITVRDIHVDGIPYKDEQLAKVAAHAFHEGTAAAEATAFSEERTDAEVFAKLAALTGVYKYDIDDPVFGGIPQVTVFIEGRKVKRVTPAVALSAAGTYSVNTVRVLMDFLMDPVWGPGLKVGDLDLSSFRRGQGIADRIMQGAASDIWSNPYPSELNGLYGTSYRTWGDYFHALGLARESDSGVPGWHGAAAPVVRRYEFHGVLYNTENWGDTVEAILETMPGARLFRSLEGKYRLGIPDPLDNARALPIITDAELLAPPELEEPDSEIRLNSVVVRFANVLLDNAVDTLEWPPPGSALAAKLLAEDGGVLLTETVTVEGVNNVSAAAAWSANYVLQSRRPTAKWTMTRLGFIYEPGDLVRLRSDRQGIDIDVVVQRVSSTRTWEAQLEGQQYHPADYLWHSEIRAGAPGTSLPALSVPKISSVTLDLVAGQLRYLQVSWVLPTVQVAAISAFDVEIAEHTAAPGPTTDRTWQPVKTVPAGGEWTFTIPIGEPALWYEVRVRGRGVTDIAGTWTQSDTLEVPEQGIYSRWHAGDGAPANALGIVGDFYINMATGEVYEKTGAEAWTLQGNIKGGDGDKWHSGAGAPGADLGKIGDWYFRTTTDQIYQKTGATTWTVRASIAPASWLSGSGAPAGSAGSVGDYYLRTSNGDVYRKTGAATWTRQGNIKGGDGDKWHSGAGAPGADLGKVGDWYLRTTTDQIYQKTGVATWTVRASIAPASWLSGFGAPAANLGNVGDYYLRTSNGDVYRKTGGAWTLQGNIKGGDGDRWHSGAGAPASNLGKIGDWYLRTTTNQLYQKTGATTWTVRATIAPGAWLSGTTVPARTAGKVGDYYLRTSNGDVYQKTGASTWTRQGNIKGGDGDKWHSGAAAPGANLGKVGDWYLRTTTDQIYQKTGATTWTVRASIAPASWLSGSGAPAANLGNVGDYYLQISNGDVYRKTRAATWTRQGNIKGGDGDRWHSGAGAPAANLGKVGDWYLRTSNGDVYQKTGATTWTVRASIAAPAWLSGSGAPAANLGNIGDYYLRTSNGDVYQKTSAGWTRQGNIKGGDGDKWHSGAGAPAANLGKVGDWYLRTSNGDVHQKTAAGWVLRANIKGDPADATRLAIAGYRVFVTAAEATALGSMSTLSGALRTKATNATQGDNLVGDIVFFYRPGFSKAFSWTGAAWQELARFIGAELIQAASLTALNLTVRDADIQGTITAAHIDANVFNVDILWTGNLYLSSNRRYYSLTCAGSRRVTDWDALLFVVANNNGDLCLISSIPQTRVIVGSASSVPSGANSFCFTTGGGRSWEYFESFRVWRNSAGTSLYFKGGGGDGDTGRIYKVYGLKEPKSRPGSTPTPTPVITPPVINPPAANPPGLPGTPTRTRRTTTTLTLGTAAPTSGGTPTLYRWRLSNNSTVSNSDTIRTTTTRAVTFTGLAADTPYWGDVRAENADGESLYTADLATRTAAAETPSNPPGLPGTPTLTRRTTTTLTLGTRAPTSGGTPALYRWRLSSNSAITDVDTIRTTTTRAVTFTGLAADTPYWGDVRAENADGESLYTADLATRTAAATTPTPTPTDPLEVPNGLIFFWMGTGAMAWAAYSLGDDGDVEFEFSTDSTFATGVTSHIDETPSRTDYVGRTWFWYSSRAVGDPTTVVGTTYYLRARMKSGTRTGAWTPTYERTRPAP